jgi:hypothetical protein
MAIASKKIKHDIHDGEVAIRPRAFVISGSGTLVDVPTTFEPAGFTGTQVDYHNYVATASNDPFLPPVGGKRSINGQLVLNGGNSTNASPGINPYSYRRIPFVHKIGGSNQITTVGNAQISEEILRFNLYGKGGVDEKQMWQTPFTAATVHFTVFPFGRSAPSEGETASFLAADNFVHARGNLSSTVYFRKRYTWLPTAPNQARPYKIWSGSGELNGTYTEISTNDSHRATGIVLPLGPDIIFNNSTAATNDLGTNPNVASAGLVNSDNASDVGFGWANGLHNGGPTNGFGSVHPSLTQFYPEGHEHAGKAKYYELSTRNPLTGAQDNNGPIQSDPSPYGVQITNYYPVNKWVGTNTSADPNTPNSTTVPFFRNGHQGEMKVYDGSLNFREANAGLIVKGLLEIY